MGNLVVLDAGPLVALINRDDFHHAWAVAEISEMRTEMLICEAVLSECFHLLRRNAVGVSTLLSYLEEGIVKLDFRLHDNLAAVASLMRKYQDVPMSLADACLVRVSELNDGAGVFTIDSDFKLYRRHSRQPIPLIYPSTR